METHSFTCKQAIPDFAPQAQSITAILWLILILPSYGGSKVESTYQNKVLPRQLNPDMVTHPSTNLAWHWLTSLIKTNALLPASNHHHAC